MGLLHQVYLVAQYLGPKSLNFSFSRGLVYPKSVKFTYWASKYNSTDKLLANPLGALVWF